ncbi:MAG TPA: hypothetical protein VGH74_15605 [Planctomycetaceae bacterium]|jgi:hypothetical protein
MPRSDASTSDLVPLLPATTATTGTAVVSAQLGIPEIHNGVLLVLDVSAAAAAAGDTLDVTVQTLIASGIWADVVHFTQVLGNGGAKRFIAKIVGPTAVALYAYAALAAGTQKDIFGDYWRVSYTIVDGGAHGQSFTFSVSALPF